MSSRYEIGRNWRREEVQRPSSQAVLFKTEDQMLLGDRENENSEVLSLEKKMHGNFH